MKQNEKCQKNKPSLISVPQMVVKVSFFLVHALFWYNFDSGIFHKGFTVVFNG